MNWWSRFQQRRYDVMFEQWGSYEKPPDDIPLHDSGFMVAVRMIGIVWATVMIAWAFVRYV